MYNLMFNPMYRYDFYWTLYHVHPFLSIVFLAKPAEKWHNNTEKDVVFLNYFAPELSPDELRKMSAIALAHMGDAVYETLVRTWLCVHGTATGKELHRATVALVCAGAQAEKVQKILPLLSEEETAVYKRGRNANVHTMSRSATTAEYHSATGLECLMGYLYLKGDKNRAEELFRAMMEEN